MGKRVLSNEQIENLKSLYQGGLSTTEVGKILGCSHNTIARTLIREGVKPRSKSIHRHKYSINEDYFKDIDSSDKAYFLGLLYADGYMDEINKGVKISLQEQDGYILESFKEKSNFTGPVSLIVRKKVGFSNSKYIQIYNRKFYRAAESKGLYSRKSLTLKFPNKSIIPTNVLSHFIRGYFDGDGCVHKMKSGRLAVRIVGTFNFLSKLQEILVESLDIKRTKIVQKNGSDSKIYALQLHGQTDINLFGTYLYRNKETIYLTRKFDKFGKLPDSEG